MADYPRVREAFRASMTAWATLEVKHDQARVIAAPDFILLSHKLTQLDATWQIAWFCESVQPFIVRANLRVCGIERGGLASGLSLADAKAAALADIAQSYSIASTHEGHWVAYTPEDGPDIGELEALALAAAQAAPNMANDVTASDIISQYNPYNPYNEHSEHNQYGQQQPDQQMQKAKMHIDQLVDKLNSLGKGEQAARIVLAGYGDNLDECRRRYKELSNLLKSLPKEQQSA